MAENTQHVLAKEKNYVSAVVYLGDDRDSVRPFLQVLCTSLSSRFGQYELILVDDASRDGSVDEARDFLKNLDMAPAVSMIHMSIKQGIELAMNAGLDMAIGDFVWEFDSMRMPYPSEMILQAYDTSLAGSDIVAVSPSKNRNFLSNVFYKLFNSSSNSKYPLQTQVFRLLSRRAINRVRSITRSMPYRKAAYAASGLKMETLAFAAPAGPVAQPLSLAHAVDSLALYTGIASRIAIGIALLMLCLMLAAVVYTLVVFFGGAQSPAPG